MVRWLFWWGHVPQEQVFACQGFFVVPKTEQGTGIMPVGVRHHLGGGGLGYRAIFLVPGPRTSRALGFPRLSCVIAEVAFPPVMPLVKSRNPTKKLEARTPSFI